MTLLILSLSFCLVPWQSSPEDQSECIGDEISAHVGWQIALVLKGVFVLVVWAWCRMFDVLGGSEGAGADRLAMEVVAVVVRHVDTTVVGAEHPMSNFLYFLLLRDLLLLSIPDLFSLTGVKGLEFPFSQLSFFIIGYFLPEGRKGLYLAAQWAV